MNLRSPGLWIGFFSLLAVLGVAIVDMRRTSPGPLATVHGRVPELNGRSGCAECHGGLLGGMTKACLDCHEVIGEQIELADGLHGSIEPERAQLCALCHSEHHGPSFALVNRSSFAQVGATSVEDFDHALIGWEMSGAHLENECSDCHENFELDVLPEQYVMLLRRFCCNSFLPDRIDAEVLRRIAVMDIHPSGPLWGLGTPQVDGEAEQLEREALASMGEFREGVERAGMKQERRSLRARISDLSWAFTGGELELQFFLPRGSYATAMLRECLDYRSATL